MGIADREKIERLQSNLSVIRKVARWTTERLGDEIGVSRQTINSLEHGKTSMTKTQYLALRAVFNHEAIASENTALAQVIQSLVDEPVREEFEEDLEQESVNKIEKNRMDAMDGLSAATGVLANRKLLNAIVAAAPVAGPVALAAMAAGSAIMGMREKNYKEENEGH